MFAVRCPALLQILRCTQNDREDVLHQILHFVQNDSEKPLRMTRII